ncbi:MAG TPA: beta-phosphoglucomutase [Acholeplasma sp.]|nr:beta-phosphoglucomutase [Acholeplasma sp.]
MNIKLIIFDLDGVIVSTDHYHYLAWKKMADEEGIFFNEQINHRLRGVSRTDSLEIILERSIKEYSESQKKHLLETKNRDYLLLLEHISRQDLLMDVFETLTYLKENNYLIAIGSASKNAKKILEKLEIIDMFDFISDGNQIKHGKPNPEVFLNACTNLGVDPKYAMVIEDADAGIDAGNNAGMITVGIGPANQYEKSQFKITRLKELITILNN